MILNYQLSLRNMETILNKIKVNSTVVADGRIYTITRQVDDHTWEWVMADGTEGIFTFSEDQLEDSSFVIIN